MATLSLSLRFSSLARSPLTWILVCVGIFHVVGIGWGLPASDGWDNDGVAPRDFLPGLAATFTPGSHYTYPPVHLALLALLTSPIVLVAVLRAPSFALHDVVHEILKVPYMTSIAFVARFVSLAMSVAIALFLARIAEEIRAHELGLAAPATGGFSDDRVRRVGWCTAAFAGMNASFAYYAHTSNLDVPYLFWASWSLLWFSRAIARRQPRLLRRAFALAVLAVATKDQAYALFLLAYPAAFALWTGADSWARGHRRAIAKEAAIAVGLALLLFAFADGAIENPTGFAARVHFLTGSASQDFVEYTHDWSGRLAVLSDAVKFFRLQYGHALGALIAIGFGCSLLRAGRRAAHLALALLPFFAALSFTICFNWTALRTDARFLLPQALAVAIYGGQGVEALFFATRRAVRRIARPLVLVAGAYGLYAVVSVDVSLLYDPRYDAEAWLRAHVSPGDTIETYGLNVYLLRFPADAHVVRVGPEPVERRNPVPGIEEVQAPFEDAPSRNARWIVVSTAWMWRYVINPNPALDAGRMLPPTQHRSAADPAATRWFERLDRGKGAFGFAHISRYEPAKLFPILEIHGTTGRWVYIYERKTDSRHQ